MLEFSPASLIAGFVFGVFGVSIISHGKREANFRRVAIGITLVGYGYFVGNPWLNWGIGLSLLGVNYFTGWAN